MAIAFDSRYCYIWGMAMNTENVVTRRESEIARIAKSIGVDTLETRRMDSLDFHSLAVWSIKDALEAAYEAGRADRKVRS